MGRSDPAIVYVCDRSRLHHLLMSVVSWRRFAMLPIAVVDIGLGDAGRADLEAVAGRDLTFVAPGKTAPIPSYVPFKQQAMAFMQKTLVGHLVNADPLIYLDSDILVVHDSFLPALCAVRSNELLATPSAWDTDFDWTYTPESLPLLRTATGATELRLDHPICNSGVWAMSSTIARRVSLIWHRMYRRAIETPLLWSTLRPGSNVGDQEFLLPACAEAGAVWTSVHGSFNMQVHDDRMPWSEGIDGHPRGRHHAEAPEPVRAIHYGCEPDYAVSLDDGILTSSVMRTWLADQYRTCRELLERRLARRAPIPGSTA